MRTMAEKGWRRVAIACLSAASLALPAEAQTLMRSPQEISRCLCQNRVVDELKMALDRQWLLYEDARRRYAALAGQVETQRAQMNVHDSSAIDAFRQLLEQAEAAELAFKTEATPAYAAAVDRYNTAVETYNQSCASAVFDPTVLEQVERGLYCPR